MLIAQAVEAIVSRLRRAELEPSVFAMHAKSDIHLLLRLLDHLLPDVPDAVLAQRLFEANMLCEGDSGRWRMTLADHPAG